MPVPLAGLWFKPRVVGERPCVWLWTWLVALLGAYHVSAAYPSKYRLEFYLLIDLLVSTDLRITHETCISAGSTEFHPVEEYEVHRGILGTRNSAYFSTQSENRLKNDPGNGTGEICPKLRGIINKSKIEGAIVYGRDIKLPIQRPLQGETEELSDQLPGAAGMDQSL